MNFTTPSSTPSQLPATQNLLLIVALGYSRSPTKSLSYCQLMTTRMVDTSNNTGVNKAEPVLLYLHTTSPQILKIKNFHYFHFSNNESGIIPCKELHHLQTQLQFLKDHLASFSFSPEDQSRRLERGTSKLPFLFPQRRQFCRLRVLLIRL